MNSLSEINPDLSKQWHSTKNSPLTPKDVSPGSAKKVWWVCSKGQEWQAAIYNRNRGKGCPYCAGRVVFDDHCLQAINPELSREWHPTLNGELTPKDVAPGTHKKVWWICNKGHEWQAAVSSRNKGNGCPYCAGQAACSDNCLETLNPELAKEWHLGKNGKLTPSDVTPYSYKKVWWICNRGHEWQAPVSNRNRGRGCPYCAGRLVCEDNCLRTVNPILAAEWHPVKNGNLTPDNVTPGSRKKVWWICSSGHEWAAQVNSRNRGSGCPYCSDRVGCGRKSIQTTSGFPPADPL